MSNDWLLPEVTADEDPHGIARPTRPNVFILRNFSWLKAHSCQLGVVVGLVIYWAVAIGEMGVALGIAVLVINVAFGEVQCLTHITTANHRLGVHDFMAKPHYGLFSTLATIAVCVAIWGVPA